MQVASVVPFRRSIQGMDRDDIVRIMAEHLVAAILHDNLDTSCDMDVIACLLNTPDRFQSRIVLDHMDSAKYEAGQMLMAREMAAAESDQ